MYSDCKKGLAVFIRAVVEVWIYVWLLMFVAEALTATICIVFDFYVCSRGIDNHYMYYYVCSRGIDNHYMYDYVCSRGIDNHYMYDYYVCSRGYDHYYDYRGST